jgi:CRISPR-associated protein Cas2
MEELERRLLREVDLSIDCLRIYRIRELRGFEVREHGVFRAVDFDAPLAL